MGNIMMSAKERRRLEVLARVRDGELTLVKAKLSAGEASVAAISERGRPGIGPPVKRKAVRPEQRGFYAGGRGRTVWSTLW